MTPESPQKSGHTPGPWALRNSLASHDRFIVGEKKNNFFDVAFVIAAPGGEGLKNANLIAAAPALLKAAKMALKVVIEDTQMDHEVEGGDVNLAMLALQDAIAEAETK